MVLHRFHLSVSVQRILELGISHETVQTLQNAKVD